jgi:2-amino-4-hydroxy-6-hydroxymethyldihydropteridine diphosphokinase
VLVGRTERSPESLLTLALATERAFGRRRDAAAARNAPRPLDIDLLFVGDEMRTAPELELPHPRLAERRFVLAPLAELLPELRLPPGGSTVSELLARLPARPWAERAGEFPAPRGAT